MKRRKYPPVSRIVDARMSRLRDCSNLNAWHEKYDTTPDELRDTLTRECWGCGVATNHRQRCHVVARANGGSDAPDNFYMLCEVCHREQPDGCSRVVQEAWLLRREFYMDATMRDAREAVEAIKGIGGKDALADYVNFIGWDRKRMFAALVGAISRSASAKPSSVYANAKNAVVEDFAQWLSAQSRS